MLQQQQQRLKLNKFPKQQKKIARHDNERCLRIAVLILEYASTAAAAAAALQNTLE
jgi:hypothetical protein